MAPAQSSPIPLPGTRLRASDWGWAVAYGLRGLGELVRARLIFARLQAADIPHRNHTAALAARAGAPVMADSMVARIGYVLPRISARLPWRSDCLIQAIAAQNWLAAKGLASAIRIGVERHETTGFGAHAWLVHDEQVVTGGDIARYHLLLAENPGEPAGS